MEYLIKNEQLELKYEPRKGAWTYHIQIPNTKHIIGKWGFLKVSGFIDNYKIESKNLFTITGQDKLLSINETIRKSIKKSGGDIVTVTLYLLKRKQEISEKQIIDTFKESDVLPAFNQRSQDEKSAMINTILAEKNVEKQINTMVRYINKLSK